MGRPYIDLTGMKFGNLTVVELYERCGAHKPVKWKCKCDCGNEKIVDSQLLRRGIIKDCGCRITNRLVGKRFGRLTVIAPTDKRMDTFIVWKCKCDCGNIAYVATGNLISKANRTVSCGCWKREQATKHGMSGTRLYSIWRKMKDRCYSKNCKAYKYYGGRGIKICDEWFAEIDGLRNFSKWATENGYSENLTLDRIDNNGDYCPENCRWATVLVQANNKSSNHYITIGGETHTVSEWARIRGVDCNVIFSRLGKGHSDYDAVMTPVKKRSRKG